MTDITIGFGFEPDVHRAEAINARMHRELGASLDHVREVSRAFVDVDEPASSRLLSDLAGGQSYPATVFAAYYDLVMALTDERWPDAQAAWDYLCQAPPSPPGLQVSVLGDPSLGSDSHFYQRMNEEAEAGLGFLAPAPEVAAAFQQRLRSGFAMLHQVLPELAGEIDAIVRQVIIAGSDPSKKMQFDGGSHYQLWGALFLNGQYHHDDLAIVEVLAHESAHSLLFGFCIDEPLVDNADDELYASPLRPDLRPMDGIYHATFVSARMHWAMNELVRSGPLEPPVRERAQAAARADLANFDAGLSVIQTHGRLTPTGSALMQSAQAYMDAAR